MTLALMITYLLIGTLAGFMSGMFGIGGGAVRIPLLNLAGLPLLSAFAINILIIPFSSGVGAFSHRKNIDKKISAYMIVGGSLGSLVGALFTGSIPILVLAYIFAGVSIISIIGLHLDRIAPRLSQRIVPNPRVIIVGSFCLNLITGMRGGSGGSLFPPFLKTMKLDIQRAIATSLFVTIFSASAAMFVYWHRGDVLLLPGLWVLIGSMFGARMGSGVSLRTKPLWLEIGLSVLMAAFALIVIYKAM